MLLPLMMKNEVEMILLPTIRSTLRTPYASDAWPLKSLNVTLVLIKSSAECPNQSSTEYDIILTAALVLTNILLIE
jgi:hypothetical protein